MLISAIEKIDYNACEPSIPGVAIVLFLFESDLPHGCYFVKSNDLKSFVEDQYVSKFDDIDISFKEFHLK